MKILSTKLIDTQFTGYSVRPFKMAGIFSYQCDADDAPDLWKVFGLDVDGETPYPLVEFDFNEKHKADKLAKELTEKLEDIKMTIDIL